VRRFRYDVIRSAAQTIGSHLVRWHPDDVTMEWSVSKRGGKVFMDVNQNVRAKTLAAIFSPRAVPEASVSMPLRWDELEQAYPADFHPGEVLVRLEASGDPWACILHAKADRSQFPAIVLSTEAWDAFTLVNRFRPIDPDVAQAAAIDYPDRALPAIRDLSSTVRNRADWGYEEGLSTRARESLVS
jgi:hypothetical protein